MKFVDQLNQMANRPSLEDKIFKDRVLWLTGAIRGACMKHANERSVQGFIFRSYDSEYNVESYVYNKNLYREYVREVIQPQYGRIDPGKYSACHSDHGAISENKDYVEKLVNAVKPLLVEDGFKTIQLEIRTYKNCYDIVKVKSRLFTADYWRERQYSEEVLGYIVEFYVSW